MKADTIAGKTPGAIYINQFANPANPHAHETGTGPELIAQMEGDIDAVVVGVGSGGTLTGVGRCMKSRSPKTEMILADPAGSVLAPYVETGRLIEAGSWAVEGIGEDFVPPNADLSLVACAYSVADPDSFEASRELLRREGILAGSSSGTLLAAALRYCKAQDRPKRVVSFVCDSGAKYLSKVFNPTFIAQEGWDHRELHGTVRDVVVSNYPEGSAGRRMQTEFIAVAPSWTVGQTIDYMRETADLPERFYEIYVVDAGGRLQGAVALDRLMRTKRPIRIADLMEPERRRVEATDDATALKYYAAAHQRLVDNPPWLFIVHDLNPRAFSKKVKGFVSPQSWFVDLTLVSLE